MLARGLTTKRMSIVAVIRPGLWFPTGQSGEGNNLGREADSYGLPRNGLIKKLELCNRMCAYSSRRFSDTVIS